MKIQPPAGYCNNPPNNLSCSFCHSGLASRDSTNFLLLIGTDSSSMVNVVSGVTTYTPGATYFLRVLGTWPSYVYGFELTAEDNTQSGALVTNFSNINTVNTAIATIGSQNYVSHHNANNNNEWTFSWTAPTTYTGPIKFYYACNDGVNGDQDTGDSIFLVTKTIYADSTSGIADISSKLNSLAVFPTVFDQQIQINFNLINSSKVEAEIVNLNGQMVKSILNEGLNAGNFNRSFDLSTLAAGVYLVKIQIGTAYAVSKIVKE